MDCPSAAAGELTASATASPPALTTVTASAAAALSLQVLNAACEGARRACDSISDPAAWGFLLGFFLLQVLNAACEVCKKSIEAAKGKLTVKEAARAVSERDDRLLAERMEALEAANREVRHAKGFVEGNCMGRRPGTEGTAGVGCKVLG